MSAASAPKIPAAHHARLFAAQNVVPLIATDRVTPEIEEVLNNVSANLTTENLTAMMVQVQDTEPADVAREFVDGL